MTLAYSEIKDRSSGSGGVITISNYITATNQDATATVYGKPVKTTGLTNFIAVQTVVTNNGGAANLTLSLQGSISGDEDEFYDMTDEAGNAITSAATAIGAASPTAPVNVAVDTVQKIRRVFPPYVRTKEVLSAGSRESISRITLIDFIPDRRYR